MIVGVLEKGALGKEIIRGINPLDYPVIIHQHQRVIGLLKEGDPDKPEKMREIRMDALEPAVRQEMLMEGVETKLCNILNVLALVE